MNKILLALVLCLSCQTGESASKEDCATARKLIEERHLDRSNVDKARSLLEDMIKEDPSNAKASVLLARAYILLGDKAAASDEKIKNYERSGELGRLAVKLAPDDPDAHFFLAAGLGRSAQLKGFLSALSAVDEVRREFERSVELDPKHVLGLNALAQYYMDLPGLFGGSIEKTEELLEKARAIDPAYSMTYVTLAKMYIRQGRREKAREMCEHILSMKDPTNIAQYTLDDKPEAEKLLKELK